jgi:hypothetical protein
MFLGWLFRDRDGYMGFDHTHQRRTCIRGTSIYLVCDRADRDGKDLEVKHRTFNQADVSQIIGFEIFGNDARMANNCPTHFVAPGIKARKVAVPERNDVINRFALTS